MTGKILLGALCVVIAYCLGSLSGAIVISRLFGLKDIRQTGSGNAGTTNVLRTLGYLPGALTLVFDAAKVYLAATLTRLVAGEMVMPIAACAALIGHVWPVWFRFKGGKGIAAGLGFALAISPWMGLILFALQIVILILTRTMSIASIVNIVLVPVCTFFITRGQGNHVMCVIFTTLGAAVALFSHRSNISRLIHHQENKLDFSRIKGLSGQKKEDK